MQINLWLISKQPLEHTTDTKWIWRNYIKSPISLVLLGNISAAGCQSLSAFSILILISCYSHITNLDNGYRSQSRSHDRIFWRGKKSCWCTRRWVKQQRKGITSSDPLAVYLGPVREEHAPLYWPFTPQIWAAQLLLNVYSSGNWLHPVKVQVTSSPAQLLLLVLSHHFSHLPFPTRSIQTWITSALPFRFGPNV